MLYEFVNRHRDEIIKRYKAKDPSRSGPSPVHTEIDHGVSVFLHQLEAALRSDPKLTTEISRTSALHGHDLLLRGCSVSQVVRDYGDVCQSITDLAVEMEAPISTEDMDALNRCRDEAIAGAVTNFGRGQSLSTRAWDQTRRVQ